jgi:phosphatidylglycerol:prolipoprotein diacylglycerol transferase
MHPILFEIPLPWGTQPLYAYGVMLGISLLLGWQVVMTFGRREGLSSNLLGDVYLTTAICGVLGARLLYVVTNLEQLHTLGDFIDIRNGGLVAYGGFIAGFLGAYVHLRIKKTPLLAFGDAASPAIALGLFFTRIGCYLYGCDFGTRLSKDAPAWLAKLGTFPHWTRPGMSGSPAFLHHVDVYGLPRDATSSFPVHPTQLYEAIVGLVLAAVCVRVLAHRRFRGQALLVLTFSYSIARFFLEYLRDDPERGEALGFSTSQWISLALVPLAAVLYSVLARKAREASLHAARAANA